eukprot:2274209-Amphidinium_carterae.1
MVKHLETQVASSPRLVDRVAAGHFLFCLFASARFSESQNVAGFRFDMDADGCGLVHAPVRSHKTAGRATAKNRLLPLMGLTRGISDGSWGMAWRASRVQAQLNSEDTLPPLPAPLGDAAWYDRKLSTSEATAWLPDLLATGSFDEDV